MNVEIFKKFDSLTRFVGGKVPRITLAGVIPGERAGLFEGTLQMVHGGQHPRVEHAGQIWRLIDGSRDDVVVRQRSRFRRRVPVLLADYVQNRILNVQQDVLDAGHVAVTRDKR